MSAALAARTTLLNGWYRCWYCHGDRWQFRNRVACSATWQCRCGSRITGPYLLASPALDGYRLLCDPHSWYSTDRGGYDLGELTPCG